MERLSISRRPATKSGDKCELCHSGDYFVAKSERSTDGAYQFQTLRCPECGHYHSERCVKLADEVRRRKRIN